MYGKKGMSPLIATILLMAFAVALGAVIMNWSAKLPEEGADCSSIRLQAQSFCIANGELQIELRNRGESTVSSIALTISDPPIDIPTLEIRNSRLARGATLDTSIPFSFSENAQVGVIPFLEVNGNAVACSEPIIAPAEVRPC